MIAIVTATLDWPTAKACAMTWLEQSRGELHLYLVGQKIDAKIAAPGWDEIAPSIATPKLRFHGYKAPEILGVVPAFAVGVQRALEDGHEIIACLHDDLEINEPAWDIQVSQFFRNRPAMGLAGFGGGIGLGAMDIYRTPYDPMQLARRGFVSNMRDANAHGARSLQPVQVACLDGFSQIGRRAYWQGLRQDVAVMEGADTKAGDNLFAQMQRWGIVHHAYDAALGCFAARLGWEAWMLPIACHHYGGRTAVGNQDYTAWANARAEAQGVPDTAGDQLFWIQAHRIVYDQFRDVLPIN